MSDEREVRAETEEPELTDEDVEAHVKLPPGDVRFEDEDSDDDVEAHVKLPPGDVKL